MPMDKEQYSETSLNDILYTGHVNKIVQSSIMCNALIALSNVTHPLFCITDTLPGPSGPKHIHAIFPLKFQFTSQFAK